MTFQCFFKDVNFELLNEFVVLIFAYNFKNKHPSGHLDVTWVYIYVHNKLKRWLLAHFLEKLFSGS